MSIASKMDVLVASLLSGATYNIAIANISRTFLRLIAPSPNAFISNPV
jgi:hypothetical protein